jgi:pantoate kinase
MLAVSHTGSLKDVLGIPALGEVEAGRSALDVDAEEEAEIAHVFDSEFGAGVGDDLL